MGVVAVAQSAPTWGDSIASAARAGEAVAAAAAAGAWLAAFPESYLPGAPDFADRFLAGSPAGTRTNDGSWSRRSRSPAPRPASSAKPAVTTA